MTLTHILVFTAFSLVAGFALPARWRGWALLAASLLGIYALQGSSPVRYLDFWLPTLSLALTVFVWAVTRPVTGDKESGWRPDTPLTALLIVATVLGLGLTRYLSPLCCLTPSRPPPFLNIVLALAVGGAVAALPTRRHPGSALRRFLPAAAILLILALFIVLKSSELARLASAGLRALNGQQTALASAVDLPWLGFSYLAFRLLHALRDFQAGKLPAYSLSEFVTYALFFPAYTAGPIDRSQHFIPELRQASAGTSAAAPAASFGPIRAPAAAPGASAATAASALSIRLVPGGARILWGVFKKFVLADSLALIALSPENAAQIVSPAWAWVLLYAYALRLYFDFSGYTDVAIGLALLTGIRLPENFDRPYLRTNLTAFWNSWHITLAQWFRAYFFNPFTRYLRGRPQPVPVWVVVLAGQVGTMLLIGLWHGLTWNFAAWGLWHGLGLFVHNRWSGWVRPRLPDLSARPGLLRLLEAGGWLLTFHYVALGWVLFALPTLPLAWHTFSVLFGGL